MGPEDWHGRRPEVRKLTSHEDMKKLAASLGRRPFTIRIIAAGRPTRAHITSVISRFMTGQFSISLDRTRDEYAIGFCDEGDLARVQECPSFQGGHVLLSELESAT